jgi:nicotinamidase-related amidase
MSSALTVTAGRGVASAQPYSWPYHGAFDAQQCALVACLDGRWRLPGPASDASDARLRELAEALREQGGVVVAVTAMPPRARTGLAETSATTMKLDGLEADVEVAAGATNGFYASPLEDVLQAAQRRDLLIAGWGLEGPVHSTMRAANDRGYECLLVTDACSSLQADLAFAACEMVRFSGGIFGAFADTASVVQCLADAPPTRSQTP